MYWCRARLVACTRNSVLVLLLLDAVMATAGCSDVEDECDLYGVQNINISRQVQHVYHYSYYCYYMYY